MNILLDLLFNVAFIVLGAGWMYSHLRSKYHRGCGNFFGECARLILTDDFNPRTIMIAFHEHMPWQGDIDPQVVKRL